DLADTPDATPSTCLSRPDCPGPATAAPPTGGPSRATDRRAGEGRANSAEGRGAARVRLALPTLLEGPLSGATDGQRIPSENDRRVPGAAHRGRRSNSHLHRQDRAPGAERPARPPRLEAERHRRGSSAPGRGPSAREPSLSGGTLRSAASCEQLRLALTDWAGCVAFVTRRSQIRGDRAIWRS